MYGQIIRPNRKAQDIGNRLLRGRPDSLDISTVAFSVGQG